MVATPPPGGRRKQFHKHGRNTAPWWTQGALLPSLRGVNKAGITRKSRKNGPRWGVGMSPLAPSSAASASGKCCVAQVPRFWGFHPSFSGPATRASSKHLCSLLERWKKMMMRRRRRKKGGQQAFPSVARGDRHMGDGEKRRRANTEALQQQSIWHLKMLQNTRNDNNNDKKNRINWFLVANVCDELAFSLGELLHTE